VRPIPIRFVLFDAGNTLLHLDYAFLAEVLTTHGHATTPLAVRIAEYGAKGVLDRALAAEPDNGLETLVWPNSRARRPSYFETVLHELDVPDDEVAPILAILHDHNRVSSLWRVVEPDTGEVLDALRARGLTLAVVSNADGRVEADLARCGLGSRFATVVDSHLVGVEKPDPEIFALALRRLGAPADASLYVGDILAVDVLGARRAGLDAVLLDPLGRYPEPVDCRRIGRLAELLELVPDERR
jgi:putative hydrolase of the HAD superfamily